MLTRKKVILSILIFLVVVFIALVVIVPLLFDVDRYRPQVASLIEKQTGKTAQIGHLALTVFPSLSIRADDFALKNPSGFPEGYFVKAQRIYARVDAGALWDHLVVIKSLSLDAPAISLLSDNKGNWNFENTPSSTKGLPDPPGEKPLFTLGAISDVKVTRGELSIANLLPSGHSGPVFFEAHGVSSELKQVDLNAFTESASMRSAAVPTEPGPVSEPGWPTSVADAAEGGGKLVAAGTVKMESLHVMNLVVTNVKFTLRLFPKQVFFDGLDFKCYDGSAVGNLSFAFPGQNPHYSSNAKLGRVNVAKLLEAFPDARGKMTGTLDGTVKLEGEVNHSPDPLAGIRGSGQITIHNGQLPSLQLNKNLLQLAQLAKMGPASGDPSSFSAIAMDFTIANNRINTTKATIVGKGIEIDGSGSLALAGEGSLDYQGVAKLAASKNALTNILAEISGATLTDGRMTLPFNLAGTLQNPIFTVKAGNAGGALAAPKGAAGQQQQPADLVQGLAGLFKKNKKP